MTPVRTEAARAAAERVLRLSRWLDAGLRLPGTRLRLGPEALFGLVPVLGDVAGLLMSLWLMVEARRAGAPPVLLWRMAGNALLDAGLGALPLVGDVFDFFFRANLRNAELLRKHFEPEPSALAPPPRWSLSRLLWLLPASAAVILWWWLQSDR